MCLFSTESGTLTTNRNTKIIFMFNYDPLVLTTNTSANAFKIGRLTYINNFVVVKDNANPNKYSVLHILQCKNR